MKSKPRKKKEKEAVVEKPVVVEVVEHVVRRNVDSVKEVLVKKHPDMAEMILKGDVAFICNRFLQNSDNRAGMARALGLEPLKCSICMKDIKGDECTHFTMPLNNCRNGLIAWLEAEAGK